MPTNSGDVMSPRIKLGQTVTQAADQGIDCLFTDTIAHDLRPHILDHFFAAAYACSIGVKQLQQAVLWEAQRGVNLHTIDENAAGLRIDLQASMINGAGDNRRQIRTCEGSCDACTKKAQFEFRRDMNLISI